MTGYRVVNLGILIEELGEGAVKDILSSFSCPLNPDVESFIQSKAIDFAKQGWAQTHLIFASYINKWALVGYFSLASKHITITSKFLYKQSKTLRKRISRFATYDSELRSYIMSAPLIAQLGKNYTKHYNTLITGDELLAEACHKIGRIQFDLGGRFGFSLSGVVADGGVVLLFLSLLFLPHPVSAVKDSAIANTRANNFFIVFTSLLL